MNIFSQPMCRGMGDPPLVPKSDNNISFQASVEVGRTGKFNVLADCLSRMDKPLKTEWTIDQSVPNSIFQMLNYPNVDLFETRFNHKLPLYVSPGPDNQKNLVHASCFLQQSCSSQDTSISVQNSSYYPSLAPMTVVLKGITTVSISSSSSSALSKTTDTSKRKVSTSKSPITRPSHLGVIKQSIKDKKFSQKLQILSQN